jgi:uncharacterized membrane protein YfcA
MTDILAIGCGSLVGFMLGLIGGGGSILATPLLLYVVGVGQPHVAIGTSALAVSANAFLNFAGHWRAGNVRWGNAIVFAAFGVLGAFGGSTLGKAFDGQRLLFLFAVIMVVGRRAHVAIRARAGDCPATCATASVHLEAGVRCPCRRSALRFFRNRRRLFDRAWPLVRDR